MNKNLLKRCGFGEEVAKAEQGMCPICSAKVSMSDFKDELYIKEYGVSGMCQSCQNRVDENLRIMAEEQ